MVEGLPEQMMARLEPNTFDLGIALAAGAIATYSKVNPGAVSSIAVALVCVMGLMLSGPDISSDQGPALCRQLAWNSDGWDHGAGDS